MKFIHLVLLTFTLLTLANCREKEESKEITKEIEQTLEKQKTGFIHTVFFWFEEDADPKLKEDFPNGLEALAKVDVIQDVYYGPAAGTPREVVDNSYDYAWVVHFASKEDQDKYQVDPIHLAFIEKYKSLWKDVKVYDSLVEN